MCGCGVCVDACCKDACRRNKIAMMCAVSFQNDCEAGFEGNVLIATIMELFVI